MCVVMNLLNIYPNNANTSAPISHCSFTDEKSSEVKLADSISRIEQDVDDKRLSTLNTKRDLFSCLGMKTSPQIALAPPANRLQNVQSQPQQSNINNQANIQCYPSDTNISFASARLDQRAQRSKIHSLGTVIGRILAHAALDSICEGKLNITGIDNQQLKPLVEYLVWGNISLTHKGKDQFYRSLSKEKRFVYRKAYQIVKISISQSANPNEPVKGWMSKRLHKLTAGIKHSMLDQPELQNGHFRDQLSSIINKQADTYVADSSAHIDKSYANSRRQKLGYAITSGFISVVRERAPGTVQRINLINFLFDTRDAMINTKNMVTTSKFNDVFTTYFGKKVNGITKNVNDTKKAIRHASNDVSLNKLLIAFKNYWFGNQKSQQMSETE